MRQFKTKAISWMFMLVMVFSIISPGSMWKVNAEETYDGYVYVTVERFTLGQGLATEPIKIGYNEEDTMADILERGLGSKLLTSEGYYGTSIDGFADGGAPEGWTPAQIPEKIQQALENAVTWDGESAPVTLQDIENKGRDKEGQLSNYDYTGQSYFMICVDNVSSNYGISSISFGSTAGDTYHNGSVIRLEYGIYNYGGDLNIAYGGTLIDFPDKDTLIQLLVDYTGSKTGDIYKAALATLEDWDATEEEVATAVADLKRISLSDTYKEKLEASINYIKTADTTPAYKSEWDIFAAARSGMSDVSWYKSYKEAMAQTVKDGNSSILDENKSTENSRVILALTAIGADPTDFAGFDLTAPLADFDYVKKQGLNGVVYALLALDCGDYQISEVEEGKTQTTGELLVQTILAAAVEKGGWAWSGTTADSDMTGMAIQALAPYYDNKDVKTSVDAALQALSDMQQQDGGYESCGSASSESCAQVLCALSALGIDAETDERFVKNDNSVLDALLSYYDESTGGFKHVATGSADGTASQQAAYALVAYSRLKNQQNGLYNMSDATCLYECDAHVWDNGKITKDATVDAKGEKTFTCKNCGETKLEEIPKLTSVATDPTSPNPAPENPTTSNAATQNPDEQQSVEEEKKTTENLDGSEIISTPKKTSVGTVKSSKKNQIKLTWKKKSGVTGYEIQVSTSSKFKKSKTKTYKVARQKATSKTIKALKSNKKYYVRIRSYKTVKVNGKNVTKCSTWSAKKSVKVK